MAVSSPIVVRRPDFGFTADTAPCWTPHRPELACAANSVSLLMPYMEPYFVRSIADALPRAEPYLGEGQADQVRAFLGQESEHHRQHRLYNQLLVARYPGLARIERAADRFYRWLGRRAGTELNVAFVAASEIIAYSAARWAAEHRHQLFDGADPGVSELFWWHMAEEVEHKSVAHEVFRAYRNRRRIYLLAAVAALLSVMAFVGAGTTVMLGGERRLANPWSWFRLTTWAVTFAFELIPNLVLSLPKRFHPDQLVDPLWYDLWHKEHTVPVVPS